MCRLVLTSRCDVVVSLVTCVAMPAAGATRERPSIPYKLELWLLVHHTFCCAGSELLCSVCEALLLAPYLLGVSEEGAEVDLQVM